MPFLPGAPAHEAGGIEAGGWEATCSVTEVKFWRRRIMAKDISLYANYEGNGVRAHEMGDEGCETGDADAPAVQDRSVGLR